MPEGKKNVDAVGWRDLPNKDQLFLLALCRLSEPLSNTCLLPYIFYLIKSIASLDDVETSRISELSGILVAAFPLAQCITSVLWGRLSDSHGRKSIILSGLFVSALSNLAFGLSKTFGALLFWRILAGLANGNVGVMRTMTAEIVKEKKYQTRAFLLLPLIFNSGMVAALALGGCLADPVTNLPWLFGPHGWLNFSGNAEGVAWAAKYPYALPALFNATVLGLSLLLATLWLRETLEGKDGTPDRGLAIGHILTRQLSRLFRRRPHYIAVPLDDLETTVTANPPPHSKREPSLSTRPPFKAIWTSPIRTALLSFTLLPLHNTSFMHILPLYLSTPPSSDLPKPPFLFTGGLGLHSPSIGITLASLGICGILLQLLIYPRLQSRLKTLGVFRLSLFIFPLVYAAAPYLSLLAPARGSGLGGPGWLVLGTVVGAQIMARTLAIPSTVVLLTEAVRDKRVLGTVHGAGAMGAGLARAVGPAMGGWVFGLGLERGIVGLVWWVWLGLVAVLALAASYLMDGEDAE